MTKTKAQLRAEAVERLKNSVGARFKPDAAVIAIVGGRIGQVDWSLECDALIDLLTDDCGPCYSCAKLAELRAENNVLRGKVGDMREDVAERDDVIAVLKAENAELTEQLESAHAKNRSLKAHIAKMQEGRHGWHVKYHELEKKNAELTAERDQWREAAGNAHDMWEEADAERNELRREVDRLTRENIALAHDLDECMAERDELKRENAKLSSDEFYLRCTLVDMNGEVVG